MDFCQVQFRRGTRLMRRLIGLTLLLVFCVNSLAMGQDNLQQLKQQIANLQQQLDAMESAPPAKRNVTQIGASRTRKVESGLVVRIYDLGDLYAIAPPYSAQLSSDLMPGSRSSLFDTTPLGNTSGMGGGMGGMGGGMFRVPPSVVTTLGAATTGQVSGGAGTVKSSQDELMGVIRETISPELWREGGGKITKLGNAFVISADDDAHQQIESLLNLFRARWGTLRTISVRGWWISLAPAELRTLLDEPTEKVTPDGPPVFGVIGEKAWQDILRIWEQPAGNGAHQIRYQATLTCYNGQTVNSLSGTQSLAVSTMNAVAIDGDTGEKLGQLGYQPQMAVVQEGLAFQITPITNISGKTVLLDVHSRLVLPTGEDESRPADKKRTIEAVLPDDVVRPVDRRRLNIHRFSTTSRVPADRPYLVGGMSLPAAETEGLQLYLFVKVSVQELRNDLEPAAKPAPAVAPVDAKEDKQEPEKK